MRKKFDEDYIEKELCRIGKKLEESITVYLIGGGAMAIRGMKDVTKDIDVVTTRGQNFRLLIKALEKSGYSEVKEMEAEYEELGAQKILENEEGCRFDVFNQQVVDKLIFSEPMEERSKTLRTEDKLQVEITSPEDIFLFKGVAGRTTDIEDMNTLVQSGLDFETIAEEIDTQVDLLGEELFITYIGEALGKLQERYGTTTPLSELLEDRIVNVYDQLEILTEVSGEMDIHKLKKNVEIPEQRLKEALKSLEQKDIVEIEDEKIKETEKHKV